MVEKWLRSRRCRPWIVLKFPYVSTRPEAPLSVRGTPSLLRCLVCVQMKLTQPVLAGQCCEVTGLKRPDGCLRFIHTCGTTFSHLLFFFVFVSVFPVALANLWRNASTFLLLVPYFCLSFGSRPRQDILISVSRSFLHISIVSVCNAAAD